MEHDEILGIVDCYPDAVIYVESEHDSYQCIKLGKAKEVLPMLDGTAVTYWSGGSDSFTLVIDKKVPLLKINLGSFMLQKLRQKVLIEASGIYLTEYLTEEVIEAGPEAILKFIEEHISESHERLSAEEIMEIFENTITVVEAL